MLTWPLPGGSWTVPLTGDLAPWPLQWLEEGTQQTPEGGGSTNSPRSPEVGKRTKDSNLLFVPLGTLLVRFHNSSRGYTFV